MIEFDKNTLKLLQEAVTFNEWLRSAIKKLLPDNLKDHLYYINGITKTKDKRILVDVMVVINNTPHPCLIDLKTELNNEMA